MSVKRRGRVYKIFCTQKKSNAWGGDRGLIKQRTLRDLQASIGMTVKIFLNELP